MKHQHLAVGMIAAQVATHAPVAQEVGEPLRFSTRVDVVSLNVTVTDQSRQCLTQFPPYWNGGWDGCAVNDLTEAQFRISEDGVQQTITQFYREDISIAMSLVIDARARLNSAVVAAAVEMVKRLRPQDDAAITGVELTEFFRQYQVTSRQRSDKIRRHVIVFFTDGQTLLDPSALVFARRSDAAVYVIAVTGDHPFEVAREPAVSLRRLASLTGGRAFFPADTRRLNAASRQIYDEVSQQYTIGYISTNTRRDGRWRDVLVQVDRANAGARTKQGYFAAEP